MFVHLQKWSWKRLNFYTVTLIKIIKSVIRGCSWMLYLCEILKELMCFLLIQNSKSTLRICCFVYVWSRMYWPTNSSFIKNDGKKKSKDTICPLFNKKKETWISVITLKPKEKKTQTIYYISTLSKLEKQHILNKGHLALKLKHVPQRTSRDLKLLHPLLLIILQKIIHTLISYHIRSHLKKRHFSDIGAVFWPTFTRLLLSWSVDSLRRTFLRIVVTHTHTISPPGHWELYSAKYCM